MTIARRLTRLGSISLLALACGGDGPSGSSVEEPDGAASAGGAAGSEAGGGASGSDGGTGGSAGASGGGGSSSGGGSGGSTGGGCASSVTQAAQVPANLLFVIDRSGSMSCNPPNGRDVGELPACQGVTQIEEEATKWEITRDALADALDELAQSDNVSVGLTVFPMVDGGPQDVRLPEDGPDVPIAPLDAAQRSAIVDFVGSVDPRGETPLANATLSSYELLRQQIVAGSLAGNTFVVLMTDGTETASQSLLSELVDTWVDTAYAGFHIRTFAIGAPGSEQARSTLSKIAFDGRTPAATDCEAVSAAPDEGDCHLDMTTSSDFAADLSQAFRDISQDQALACDFELPANPSGGGVDLAQVNVTFTSSQGETLDVLLDDSAGCDSADGWQFSSDYRRIVLCGSVCDQVQADLGGEVGIVLGCPTNRRIR